MTSLPLPGLPPPLDVLPQGHQQRLIGIADEVAYPAGSRLFEEGGPADRFWVIRSGKVALDFYVPGRQTAVVETLGPGQLLGWSWIGPPYRWHLGAQALGRVHTWKFDVAGVRALCAAEPELGYELMSRCAQMAVERLQATRIRLLDLYAPRGGDRP